jgi:polar amino acid transport system substrate-binding protein
MRMIQLAALAMVAGVAMAAGAAEAQTLDKIRSTGKLAIGYRSDTIPFSFKGEDGTPRGYSIELCKRVAHNIGTALGIANVEPVMVEVDTQGRFDQIIKGEIDILCSADTITLSRREQVDFSLLTFATGGSLLYRPDGPQTFEALKGQKVGVHAGTTTEAGLRELVQRAQLDVTIVPVQSHEEGVKKLVSDELAAYFGDGAILLFYYLTSPDREHLKLSDKLLSFEPYALPIRRGDDDFRLAVDRALASVYRSGQIGEIFANSFGGAKPSELVQAMYRLQALPE